MNLDQIEDIKELKALKSKIEKKIKSQTLKPAKVKLSTLYPSIKDDHKRHVRPDGRKVFRSVVDYLECYVKGIPPVSRAEFYKRFGIESRRAKVTPEAVSQVKTLLNTGKTLAEIAAEVGLSVASCQKIKAGAYN
tara:strand:+ start:8968 stop:9372 length:405 start_codon:yes stop_codon:yes gene_type:complete